MTQKVMLENETIKLVLRERKRQSDSKVFHDLVVIINGHDFMVCPKSFYSMKANSLFIHDVKRLAGVE